MVDNKSDKIIWQILLWCMLIIIGGGSWWATVVQSDISAIKKDLSDKGERIVRLETYLESISGDIREIRNVVIRTLHKGGL